MHGYGSHTFMWLNAAGERFWVKYHFKTVQGVENFTDAAAAAMTAEEPDYHLRDLYTSIERGDAPEWRLEMQIMPFDDAANYRINPFDVTRVWPHADYPTIPIGRFVLNRNPENYFAEVEQAAFEPANMVPGIGPSPDKMLLGRMFSYPDAHRYRIGTNYLQLPINRPIAEVHSYNKDGSMRYRHSGSQPVYAPNSYGGPKADERRTDPGWFTSGEMVRTPPGDRETDDFVQPGILYRDVMSDIDRHHLAGNIVGHLRNGVTDAVARRAIAYWEKVDRDLGRRVAAGLGIGSGPGDAPMESTSAADAAD
jgi:catalase